MKLFRKTEQGRAGWIFLSFSVILFAVVSVIKQGSSLKILAFAWGIMNNIAWVFILVFVFMVLTNYVFRDEKLVRILADTRSVKSWIVAIVTGILSSGPIYMWYPLLDDLKKKGISSGLIATFLYNRAVKIPLIPVMIVYFGVKYVVVLAGVMIFASVLQGLIIEKICGVRT